MSELETATQPQRIDEGSYRLTIPDGWQQGRGAFGGLTIGALVRAVVDHAASADRSVRSITAELPGPTMTGPASIDVRALRVGSGQATYAAALSQTDGAVLQGSGDDVRAHAVVVLAKRRAESFEGWNELAPPSLRPWREMPELSLAGAGPTFSQHFEYRTDGPFPFTGGSEARALGWIRTRTPVGDRDAAWLVAMADAWWPAAFSRATAPRPAGTVAFTMQIIGNVDGLDPEAPLAYRAHAWVAREGWIVEQRELWGEDGRPIALNQQTIAIIK